MRKNIVLTAVFVISFIVFSYILTFTMNGSLYFSLLSSNISVLDKLEVLGEVFSNSFTNIFSGINGFLVFLVAVFQSIAVTLMVYAKKYSNAKTICKIGKETGAEGVALIISFIGVGCPTCGTSLIAPLIALFISGVSGSALTIVGNLMLVISCLLSLFAILNLVYQIKRTA
ncbi:MAG: hypothetical protein LBB10_03615 [Bifidobacteriaceae bacterium]|jgi:hypothetical protein|nr:hypothetical protein [Bifidobacteriaceae bacterium]